MPDDPIPALKEQLARAIVGATSRMSQLGAAHMLGLDESRMSNIQHGQLERFSLQKLIRLLARINRRTDLTVVIVGPLPKPGYQEFWDACEWVRAWNARHSRR